MHFSLTTKKSQKNQRQTNYSKASKKFLEVFFLIIREELSLNTPDHHEYYKTKKADLKDQLSLLSNEYYFFLLIIIYILHTKITTNATNSRNGIVTNPRCHHICVQSFPAQQLKTFSDA